MNAVVEDNLQAIIIAMVAVFLMVAPVIICKAIMIYTGDTKGMRRVIPKVVVDGVEHLVSGAVMYIERDNRMRIRLQQLLDVTGWTFEVSPIDTTQYIIHGDNHVMRVRLGNCTAILEDGSEHDMGAYPLATGNGIYMPLRGLAALDGCDVDWCGEYDEVRICKEGFDANSDEYKKMCREHQFKSGDELGDRYSGKVSSEKIEALV